MKKEKPFLTPQESIYIIVLREHPKGISTMELIRLTNTTRPNTTIYNLRKKGFVIETIRTRNPNTNKSYGIYELISEPGE